MRRFIRKFKKSFRYGEKGFTLIELLIVVAILGVLAALIIPNVTTFMESGRVGAGRAERSQLQVAVDGMMADAGETAIVGGAGWQGGVDEIGVDNSDPADGDFVDVGDYDANDYLRRFPTDGTFSVATDGIVSCTAYPGLDAEGVDRINEVTS